MVENATQSGEVASAMAQSYALAAAAEASVAELEERLPTGMGPLERVEAARIRAAAQRLRECAQQLASEGLMVRGSMGQQRAHPLLKVEQELRRELSTSVKNLAFWAPNHALVTRAQERNKARRQAAREGKAQ